MSATKKRWPVSQSILYGATFLECATSPGMALENITLMQIVHGRCVSGDRQLHNDLRIQSSRWEQLGVLFENFGTGSDRSFVPCGVEAEWEEASVVRPPEAPVDSSEAVARIRASLSLQIKELATVLGVERPTIYAWLRGTAQPQPHNRERIAELLDLSKRWSTLSSNPLGSDVRNCLCADGKTLVALLCSPRLDRTAIESHMRNLATRQHDEPKGIHEIAKSRGIDLSSVRQSQSEFDVLTGKPFDEV